MGTAGVLNQLGVIFQVMDPVPRHGWGVLVGTELEGESTDGLNTPWIRYLKLSFPAYVCFGGVFAIVGASDLNS